MINNSEGCLLAIRRGKLFQKNSCGFEFIASDSFYLQIEVIVGIVLHEVTVVIGPHIAQPGKSIYRYLVVWRNIDDVGSVNCKEQVIAV